MGWFDGWFESSSKSSADPNAVAIAQGAMDWGAMAANKPYIGYTGQLSTLPTADELYAKNNIAASYNVGANELNQAWGLAGQVSKYQPSYIRTGDVKPQYTTSQNTTAGMTSAAQHGYDRTTARNAGTWTGDQFMPKYFNPFLTQVGGNMVGDMERARRIQQIADEDKALAAGAYGGMRHGVMDAESSRGFFDVLGSNLTDLYARGFDTAADLGMKDAQRFTDTDRFNADRTLLSDQGNADRRLTSDRANADRLLQSDQGNMDRRLRSDVGNADRRLLNDQGNTDRAMRADISNMDRWVDTQKFNSNQYRDSFDMRLRAGDLLRGIGDTRHDNYLDSGRAHFDVSSNLRQVRQDALDRDYANFRDWRDYDFKRSEHMLKAFDVAGRPFSGKGTTTSTPSGMQQAGGILDLVGGIFDFF